MISGFCFGAAAALFAAVLYLVWPAKKRKAHPLEAPDLAPETRRQILRKILQDKRNDRSL
jgi:hypothetical protein